MILLEFKPVNFPAEEVITVVRSEVLFHDTYLESISIYSYFDIDMITKVRKEQYNNTHYIMKRTSLSGVQCSWEEDWDKWKVNIFTSILRDLEFYFDTESDARHFTDQMRKYIFCEMKCTT